MEESSPVQKTYTAHDCFAWEDDIWVNSEEYTLHKCGICNTITHFRFKSFWLQLRFLFWGGSRTFRKHKYSQENPNESTVRS